MLLILAYSMLCFMFFTPITRATIFKCVPTDALSRVPEKLVDVLAELNGGEELDDEADRLKLHPVQLLGVHLLRRVNHPERKHNLQLIRTNDEWKAPEIVFTKVTKYGWSLALITGDTPMSGPQHNT